VFDVTSFIPLLMDMNEVILNSVKKNGVKSSAVYAVRVAKLFISILVN
jgi:hypothetical protein